MIKRPPRHQRNRTRLTISNAPPGAQITPSFAISAGKARITTSAPVVVQSIPLTITRQAGGAGAQLLPTAVTVVNSTTFDLTYAAAVVATDVLTIPANVQEVRGTAGGFLAAAVHTF